jgi:hypothetical protein
MKGIPWLSTLLSTVSSTLTGDHQLMTERDTEFISIPEWARRVGVSADSAYKAARLGRIPGCFSIGRLYRVNWLAFARRTGCDPTDDGPSADAGAPDGTSRFPR